MEQNTLKLIILGPFILFLFLYFAKQDNFEMLLGAIVVAAVAYFVMRKDRSVIGEGQ